ncbi:MerR family transcriptional regulator [Embleya sp. NBC_00896]|uniref:helix-turn-helix domain-containing protein n=1 Tax=Embleya sp. NBC_00896 TaxID=2975961 RepID=UPI0038640E0C
MAARFGLATHVLRHWEHVGLLRPHRDAAGRRRYGDADAIRIAVILRAKEAGLALEDIGAMFTTADPHLRREALHRQRAALETRIAQARASLAMVECALACTHDDLADCPTFRGELTGMGARENTSATTTR